MLQNKINWSDLKAIAISKGTTQQIQYVDEFISNGTFYTVSLTDSSLSYYCRIAKTTPRNADQIDFEDNYKASANKLLQPKLTSDGSLPVGATHNSALPTLSNGEQVSLQVDQNGRLITNASILPTTSAKFSFGQVSTSATTANQVVRNTVYTEQTTNAQRSIASANANDSSAGTGARTVRITYLDQTGAGPFTETVTMNGVTYVNTVATNICFIEKIEVMSVGSTGSNVGILTLKAATAGGGATIGTVTATANRTFWAHHYVPTGKTTYVSGVSVGNASTVVGSGAFFILQARNPTVSTSPLTQVSDTVRLYGQSSTNTRAYLSPIQIPGPAIVAAYVTPQAATALVQYASFDYIDN
jgi:hypothetical protein